MSAISEVFARCREERRSAFIPYLTAGDPDLETTAELLKAMAAGGADLIELGVPFSDPIADGPVIQRASSRALASGTNMSGILRLVARQRDRLGVPILLFSYYNPIHARGVESFAELVDEALRQVAAVVTSRGLTGNEQHAAAGRCQHAVVPAAGNAQLLRVDDLVRHPRN